MLAIVLKEADDRLLGALSLQKNKNFRVYLPEKDPIEADYDAQLVFRHGDWRQAEEPLTCILEKGALPDKNFVGRVLLSAKWLKKAHVFHVNLMGAKSFPCKVSQKKFFKLALIQDAPIPLSCFVFRSAKLREKSVHHADGGIQVIPTVLGCLEEQPMRNVLCNKLIWQDPEQGPITSEEKVMENIDVLRWTETYYGDDDYPLSVGDQLAMIARQIAKLYPAKTEDELKELMATFQVAQGTVRKMRASSALKNALKEKVEALKRL